MTPEIFAQVGDASLISAFLQLGASGVALTLTWMFLGYLRSIKNGQNGLGELIDVLRRIADLMERQQQK